jgi:hypothetical protein
MKEISHCIYDIVLLEQYILFLGLSTFLVPRFALFYFKFLGHVAYFESDTW